MGEREVPRSREVGSPKIMTIPHPPSPLSPSRHPRPPNRVKHEQQMEQLGIFIGKAEAERGSLINKVRVKRSELDAIRKERDGIAYDKARVFEHLESYNKEVRLKGDLVQKLRSGLSYGRLEEIEEQIKRLEWQLARNTFKVPEEKRLVGEIDRLRRNRKMLLDYTREREELAKLRDEQRVAREEREEWFKCSRETKGKEDQMRSELKELLDKMEEFKKQAEQLRQEKRTLLEDYRSQENSFRKWQSERRAEQKRKTELERAQAAHEAAAELAELKATCEPLLADRQLCSALLQYCEKLRGNCSNASTPGDIPPDQNFLTLPLPLHRRRSSGFSTNSGCSSHYGTPLGVTPATTPISGSPPVSIDEDKPGFYKKKDDSEIFYAGSRRKNKKCRSERRLSLKKGLNHNPEIFQQFSSLGLSAPSNMATVGEVAMQLREKLNQLEIQAAEIKLARLNVAHKDADEVDGKVVQVPEIKVVCEPDKVGPPIFLIEPPSPKKEAVKEAPKTPVDQFTSKLKRSGLTLDLQCHASPETPVHNNLNTPNTSDKHDGDSKSPLVEIPCCDKMLNPMMGSSTLNIVPPSPGPYAPHCTKLLQQNQQNLLITNNL